MGRALEFAVGVLNGAVGDHLQRTGNGLATPMAFMHNNEPLVLQAGALAGAYPNATGRVVVLVHGVMCTEDVFRFPDDGTDYGTRLQADVGFTPVYLRYNSGLAIPENGRAFSGLLGGLVDAWPVPVTELLLLGYSMGGLIIRSACHHASVEGAHWLGLVRRALYVGTPHRGAPMERAGRVLARVLSAVDDPTTRLLADVANLRSDGVKDLGDADLTDAHRASRQWHHLSDRNHPVPLLPSIQHHLLAGAVSADPAWSLLFGDSVVPVRSATNGQARNTASAAFLPQHVRVLDGINHLGLAHHPHVYAQILEWIRAPKETPP